MSLSDDISCPRELTIRGSILGQIGPAAFERRAIIHAAQLTIHKSDRQLDNAAVDQLLHGSLGRTVRSMGNLLERLRR